MNKAELAQVRDYFKGVADAEAAVAGFYALCFDYWPEEELWGNLAIEEKRHSETALAMLAAAEARPDAFSVAKPLNLKALELFRSGVLAAADKVRSGAYRKRQAMAYSLDLEKTIIESRYEALLKTGDREYLMAVAGLKDDTARHARLFAGRIATLDIVR